MWASFGAYLMAAPTEALLVNFAMGRCNPWHIALR